MLIRKYLRVNTTEILVKVDINPTAFEYLEYILL